MTATGTALIRVTEGQIVAGEEFRMAVESLAQRAAALCTVKDLPSYQSGLEIVSSGRRDAKAIEALAEPERLRLAAALADLRAQRDKIIAEIEAVVGPIEDACRKWRLAEQEAAAREEARLNKGKRPEARVEVKPNTPPVPGARLVTRYRVEVVNARKVKREWLVPDLARIAEKARHDKDPALTEREVGGIRVIKE